MIAVRNGRLIIKPEMPHGSNKLQLLLYYTMLIAICTDGKGREYFMYDQATAARYSITNSLAQSINFLPPLAKVKTSHGSLGGLGVKAKGGRGLDAGIFVLLTPKELVDNVLAL